MSTWLRDGGALAAKIASTRYELSCGVMRSIAMYGLIEGT